MALPVKIASCFGDAASGMKERRHMPPLEVDQIRALRAQLFCCLWAVNVDQPFDQIASCHLAKYDYLANTLAMMKRYILLVLYRFPAFRFLGITFANTDTIHHNYTCTAVSYMGVCGGLYFE